MKTKIFRLMLPLVVIVFAVSAAVGSHAATKAPTADIVGYIQHIGQDEPCEASTKCNELGSVFCRVNMVAAAPLLWKKTSATQCSTPLYRPEGRP